MSEVVKAGWKTTEFWLSTIAMTISMVYASGALTAGSVAERVIGIAAMVLASLGYSVSRGMAKK